MNNPWNDPELLEDELLEDELFREIYVVQIFWNSQWIDVPDEMYARRMGAGIKNPWHDFQSAVAAAETLYEHMEDESEQYRIVEVVCEL